VEYGLAADAAVQQGVDRGLGLAPGALEFNLAIEPSADGQRFAFLLVTGESPALTLVLNWWALMGASR